MGLRLCKYLAIIGLFGLSSLLEGGESTWKNSLAPTGERQAPLLLAENAVARYKIIISENASDDEKVAAADLAKYLAEISGAEFRISPDSLKESEYEISVGATNRVPESIKFDSLKKHSYTIRVEDKRVFLLGGSAGGILNAVYALLEEDLGCRWYSDEFSRIPREERLILSVVNRTYAPQVISRDPFVYVTRDKNWARRNRISPAQYGGGYSVHSYRKFIPKDVYLNSNPEYFGKKKDGSIHPDRICELNDGVAKVITSKILDFLKENPDTQYISVSRNDGVGSCMCTQCQEFNAKEGSESGALLYLVNKVAERVAVEYPDVVITTLAYLETIAPPRNIKPLPNVGIRICNDRSWGAMLRPIENDAYLVDVIKKWRDTGAKIYIWDYQVDFGKYLTPTPNLEVLEKNIDFYLDHNVHGILMQANYKNKAVDREWLRAWVLAKMLWDPTLELSSLLDDFIKGYYGAAAPEVLVYHKMLQDLGRENEAMRGRLMDGIKLSIFSVEWIAQADALLVKAEEKADNEQIRAHVRYLRLGTLFVKLMKGPEFIEENYPQDAQRFVAYCRELDVPKLREHGGPLEEYEKTFEKKWQEHLSQ